MLKIDFYRPFLFPILCCSKLKNWCCRSKSLMQQMKIMGAANRSFDKANLKIY